MKYLVFAALTFVILFECVSLTSSQENEPTNRMSFDILIEEIGICEWNWTITGTNFPSEKLLEVYVPMETDYLCPNSNSSHKKLLESSPSGNVGASFTSWEVRTGIEGNFTIHAKTNFYIEDSYVAARLYSNSIFPLATRRISYQPSQLPPTPPIPNEPSSWEKFWNSETPGNFAYVTLGLTILGFIIGLYRAGKSYNPLEEIVVTILKTIVFGWIVLIGLYIFLALLAFAVVLAIIFAFLGAPAAGGILIIFLKD